MAVKNSNFLAWHSVDQKSEYNVAGLCSESHKAELKVLARLHSHMEVEESFSQIIQVVGRIHFSVARGLRFLLISRGPFSATSGHIPYPIVDVCFLSGQLECISLTFSSPPA